jgi:hypothetical protein
MPLLWRSSGESHNPNYDQYIGQDGYVTFKKPEHHDNHPEDGDH